MLVASTVRRCKRAVRSDNSALIWVMPYPGAAYRRNTAAFDAYYDAVEVRGGEAHFKAAFQTRNRIMVDRSDLVVFYVEHTRGGAYQTLRYAEKEGKPFINLAKT